MYNLKIIHYPNGECQVRWFEKPIKTPDEETPVLDGYESQSLFADIEDAYETRGGGGPTLSDPPPSDDNDYHSASRSKRDGGYPLKSRSYLTPSNSWGWDWSKLGNARFGHCLDGTDDIRLDYYKDWPVDYCYLCNEEGEAI